MLPVGVDPKEEGVAGCGASHLGANLPFWVPYLENAAGILFRAEVDADAESSSFHRIVMPVDVLMGRGRRAMQPADKISDLRTSGYAAGNIEKRGLIHDELQKEPGPVGFGNE